MKWILKFYIKHIHLYTKTILHVRAHTHTHTHTHVLTHTSLYIYTHTHTMEYYSAIKKNKIMPFVATWMELEILILSEVSQKKTNTI